MPLFMKRKELPNFVQAILLELDCYSFTVRPVTSRSLPDLSIRSSEDTGHPPVSIRSPAVAAGQGGQRTFGGSSVTIMFDGGIHKIGAVAYDTSG